MRIGEVWIIMVILVTLGVFACGNEQPTEQPTPTPAQEPTKEAGTAPEKQPEPTKDATKAPTKTEEELPFEERAKALAPVVPTPAPQTAGTVTLTPQVCTFDGAEMLADSSFKAIGDVALASDGTIYLLDHEAAVRRYKVQPGDECQLALVPEFGEGGVLKLAEGIGRAPGAISADTKGHVFVSSSMGGSWRITGNKVDYHCQKSRGDVRIDPTGTIGLALFGSGTPQKVTYSDTGCEVEEWTPQEDFERHDSVGFIGKRVFVGGSDKVDGRSGPHLVREHNIKGAPQGDRFGSAESNAPDHFCHVHSFLSCKSGVCVVDGNCRALRIFDTKRAIIGEIGLMKMLGLRYPWISGFTNAHKGTGFVTATQERGKQSRVYQGLIYRVTGL